MTTATVNYSVAYNGDFTTPAAAFTAIGTDLTVSSTGHTLRSGSTTMVINLATAESTKDFTGHPLTIGATTCLITSYNTSTQVATVSALAGYPAAFGTSPSSGTSYTIADVAAVLTIGQTSSGNNAWYLSGATTLTLSGITTSSTDTITLQGASGWDKTVELQDNEDGIVTQPPFFDTTAPYGVYCMNISVNNVIVKNLQFANQADGGGLSYTGSGSIVINGCMLEVTSDLASNHTALQLIGSAGTATVINSIIYNSAQTGYGAFTGDANGSFYGCTFLGFSTSLASVGSGTTLCVDCAFLNCATGPWVDSYSAPVTFTNCITDISNSFSITPVTPGTSILSQSDPDFRVTSGSALANVGTTDSHLLVDIFGVTRSLSTPTVGVMELAANTHPIAISISSSSSVTGALIGKHAMAETVSSASSMHGALGRSRPIAESISSTSSVTSATQNLVVYGSGVNIGGNNPNSEVLYLSSNGQFAAGFTINASGRKDPFFWSPVLGVDDLGNFGGTLSLPTGISSDGTTIVGYSATPFLTGAIQSNSSVTATIAKSGTASTFQVAAYPDNSITGTLIGGLLATTAGSPPAGLTGVWNNSGGTATISNVIVNGKFTSFRATTPSSAGTYTLTVTGSGGGSAATGNIVIAASTADFSPGIYGPTTVTEGIGIGNGLPLGSYFARGLIGPQTAFLTDTVPGSGDSLKFSIAVPNPVNVDEVFPMAGWTLFVALYNQPNTSFHITVNITDGVTSYTLPVTVLNPQTAPAYAVSSNIIFDSYSLGDIFPNTATVCILNPSQAAGATLSDPSGLFTLQAYYQDFLILTSTSNLTNYGVHNITVTPTGGAAQTIPIYIAHDAPPSVTYTPSTPIYTSTPPTDQYFSNQIGTVGWWADSGLGNYLNLSTGPVYYTTNPNNLDTWAFDPFFGRSGATYLTQSLSAGNATGTLQVISGSGQSTNLALNLPVVTGTTYDGTHMPGTVTSGLTNFLTTAAINNGVPATGTPPVVLTLSCTAFTPNWSLTTIDAVGDNCQFPYSSFASPNQLVSLPPRYVLTGSGTSASVTAWNLSAVNETTPQVDQLKITLTDGLGNYCTNTFNITTGWHTYTGAALSVGPGGTWATADLMFAALWASPSTYAGATITVLHGIAGAGDWDYDIIGAGHSYQGYWPCPIHLKGDSSTKATFTGSISNGSGSAGNILLVSSSTGLAVGQWINTGSNVAAGTYLSAQIDSTHWTVTGSPQLVTSNSMTTAWAHIPLNFFNSSGQPTAPGGGGKGGLSAAGGYDLIFERLEIYGVSNIPIGGSGNAGGIYVENDNPGNLTVNNCYIHNCDMGIINGDTSKHLYITNNLLAANGGGTFSHNYYCDGVASLTFTGNYSVDSIVHEMKTRAYNATITNNFLLEGLNWQGNGTAFEAPSGGTYNFSNNVLMKGCDGVNANNGGVFDWNDEAIFEQHPEYYPSVLTANNNILINLRDPNAGAPNQPTAAWRNWMNYDPVRQIPVTATINNTQFYALSNTSQQNPTAGASYVTPFTLTNATNITTIPPGISLIDPVTGGAPFNLPLLALSAQAPLLTICNAPGTYSILMTVPHAQPSNTAVQGGLIALYAQGSATPVSGVTWTVIGGTNSTSFHLVPVGNTCQVYTSSALTDGIYYVQVQAASSAGTAQQYFAIIVAGVVTGTDTGFPGQSTFPVGHTNAPGYPGSLTAFSGTITSGTLGNPNVISYKDFNNGTTSLQLSGLSFIQFTGCRFQSNAIGPFQSGGNKSNIEILANSHDIKFSYCSFTPLASIATSIPGAAWPAAGAGQNTTTQVAGTNALSETSGYVYGLNIESISGLITVDHCDMWGFGNIAIDLSNTTSQVTITNNWIHDCLAEGSTYNQHQDCLGYLNGGVPPQNVTVSGNTIAGMGNTNAIAFQGTNTAYVNIQVTKNYLSGFGFTACLPGGTNGAGSNQGGTSPATNCSFTGNTFGTDIRWVFGPLYATYTSNYTAATWNNNTINIIAGSIVNPNQFPMAPWTVADSGKFIWPDSTLHTTDFQSTGFAIAETLTSHSSVALALGKTSGSGGPTGFPGQSTNPVGHAAALNYPGSLTSASATISASASFKLFDGGTNPPSITGNNLTFTGCYFGASTNVTTGHPMVLYPSGGGHTFINCTFGPSPSVVGGAFPPMPPSGGGYSNWPSLRGSTDSVGIPVIQGNQYGVVGSGVGTPPGGLTFTNCDIWAFNNGVVFSHTNQTNPLTFNNCWLHDPCLPDAGAHTDAIGDVQSQSGDTVTHLTITGCTIAGVSSEAIALQLEKDCICNNITITGNYISCAASWMLYLGLDGLNTPATNYKFMNNTISDVFVPQFGICGDGTFGTYVKPDFSRSGSGNEWRGNMVLPGTYGNDPNSNPQLIVTLSNQFLLPDMTASNTDFTGAF